MTKIAKVVAVGLLLAAMTLTRANAQTTSTYRTNLLINLSFNLTAYEQTYLFLTTNAFAPTAKTAKVVTAGLIRSIRDYAHITNNLDNAKLYWRLSWIDPTNVSPAVIVRNPGGSIMGTNDAVVTGYLNFSFLDSVSTTRATLTGTTNSTDYANCSVTMNTSQGSFTLHGLGTVKSASLFNGKTLIDPNPYPISFTVPVAGSGSIAFHQAEWKGTIIGSGQKVETVLDTP